jgi:hypothetical protein
VWGARRQPRRRRPGREREHRPSTGRAVGLPAQAGRGPRPRSAPSAARSPCTARWVIARGPGSPEARRLATLWTLAGQAEEAAAVLTAFAAATTDAAAAGEARAEAKRLTARPDPFAKRPRAADPRRRGQARLQAGSRRLRQAAVGRRAHQLPHGLRPGARPAWLPPRAGRDLRQARRQRQEARVLPRLPPLAALRQERRRGAGRAQGRPRRARRAHAVVEPAVRGAVAQRPARARRADRQAARGRPRQLQGAVPVAPLRDGDLRVRHGHRRPARDPALRLGDHRQPARQPLRADRDREPARAR